MGKIQPVGSSILKQVRYAYRKNPVQTIAIGIGVAIVAPTVLPLAKPLAKAVIKSGVSLYEKTKGALAETGEVIGDIVAEAKAEVAAEQAKNITVSAGLMATSNTTKDAQLTD